MSSPEDWATGVSEEGRDDLSESDLRLCGGSGKCGGACAPQGACGSATLLARVRGVDAIPCDRGDDAGAASPRVGTAYYAVRNTKTPTRDLVYLSQQ